MKCLCCGKEILNPSSIELDSNWHKKCIKSFFNTSSMPSIAIDNNSLLTVASAAVNKGLTIPGVQKKLSLHLEKGANPRLTLINYPTGYILKPQSEEYSYLPEYEYLVMQMAKNIKISTVPFGLIKLNDSFAYITKRIDRISIKNEYLSLAMEDFCQLDGKLTENKYIGSYEQCGKIINKYSSRKGLDIIEFYIRVLFSFIVGNSDMHLKNFSLIQESIDSNKYVLSDAYDLISTNLIIPSDEEELALTLNGKKKNIHKKDFILLANNLNIEEKVALKIIDNLKSKKESFLQLINESYLPRQEKESFVKLIEKRIAVL